MHSPLALRPPRPHRFLEELRAADRTQYFEQVAAGRGLLRSTLLCATWVVAAPAAYGWMFGLWRGQLLAAYVAIKLPLLLLATTATVMVLNWLLGQAMGSGLRLLQVAALTYRAMATACLILAALAPVAWVLSTTCPPPDREEALSHNLLLLCHIFLVGAAALVGNATMLQGLRRLARPGCRVLPLYLAWIGTHVFVGCQLSWILRPFMGSPNYPVVFLRENALEGNFYEFVFGVLIRDLLGV